MYLQKMRTRDLMGVCMFLVSVKVLRTGAQPSVNAETCKELSATQDTQHIYSHPGFISGEKYDRNTDVCWNIHADNNAFSDDVRIQLWIEYIELEDTDGCLLDYLDIYSGNKSSDSGGTLHGRYCTGNSSNTLLISNEYSMHLRFVSDGAKQESGFKLTYKAVLSFENGSDIRPVLVNGCHYLESLDERQHFYSHDSFGIDNYPRLYDDCWIIHLSNFVEDSIYYGTRKTVLLSANQFELEYETNCDLDYIAIYNGNTTDAILLSKQCGDVFTEVPSTGPFMYVHFHSDKSEDFQGFSMEYTVAIMDDDNFYLELLDNCTYLEGTTNKKFFTSHPEYGTASYSNLSTACWFILKVAEETQYMQLQVKSFSINYNDHVKVYEYTKKGRQNLIGTYSGSEGFVPLISKGRYFYITFHTDSIQLYSAAWGFSIEYFTTGLVNGCQYFEAEDTIQGLYSHNGFRVENYPNLLDKCWIVHLSPNIVQPINNGLRKVILLSSVEFSLNYRYQDNDQCDTLDYVAVYDSNMTSDDLLLGRHCGQFFPTMMSTGSYMYIHFHSDASGSSTGFALQYNTTLVDAYNNRIVIPDTCEYLEATEDRKTFVSHESYGVSKYRNNYFACWFIAVATGKPNDVVQLKKIKFSTESSYYDYVDVYEYISQDRQNILGKYGGSGFDFVASNSTYMYITFATDSSSRHDGFLIEYYAVDRDDALNGLQFQGGFPGWGIFLIILAILLVPAVIIAIIIFCNYNDVMKMWKTRSFCQLQCSENDENSSSNDATPTNAIESGAASAGVTSEPVSNNATGNKISHDNAKDSTNSKDHEKTTIEDSVDVDDVDVGYIETDIDINPPAYTVENECADEVYIEPPPPYPGNDASGSIV